VYSCKLAAVVRCAHVMIICRRLWPCSWQQIICQGNLAWQHCCTRRQFERRWHYC